MTLDKQGRLQIPQELLDLVSLDYPGNVIINYDFDNHSLYLDSPSNLDKTDCCVAYRKMDDKGRINLKTLLPQFFEADTSLKFLVCVRYGRIHISKFD